jgi:uncharacterized membrane protein
VTEQTYPLKQAIRTLTSMISPRYINLTFVQLFWIFTIGSFIGLVAEDLFHMVVYHEWESRAGLVWGPFSSIYGLAAVLLTIALNRLYYAHNIFIFLISMVLGSALEYGASLMMETFWHAIAWDYTGTFGSIDGRTNFMFGVIWGTMGLAWVRLIMPLIKQSFDRVNFKNAVVRIISMIMVVFMTVNIALTILSLHREGQRTENIPPATIIDVWLDEYFPDEWMHERFANMTVSIDVGQSNSEEAI